MEPTGDSPAVSSGQRLPPQGTAAPEATGGAGLPRHCHPPPRPRPLFPQAGPGHPAGCGQLRRWGPGYSRARAAEEAQAGTAARTQLSPRARAGAAAGSGPAAASAVGHPPPPSRALPAAPSEARRETALAGLTAVATAGDYSAQRAPRPRGCAGAAAAGNGARRLSTNPAHSAVSRRARLRCPNWSRWQPIAREESRRLPNHRCDRDAGGALEDSRLGGAAAEEGRERGRRRGRGRPGAGRDCRRDGGGGRREEANPVGEGRGPLRNPLRAPPRCAQPLSLPAGGPAPSRHCSRHRDRAARHGAEAGPGDAALAAPQPSAAQAVPPTPLRGGRGRRASQGLAVPRTAALAPIQVRRRGAARRRPPPLPLRAPAAGRGCPRGGCGPRAPAGEPPAAARPRRLLRGSRVAVPQPAGEGVWPGAGAAGRGGVVCVGGTARPEGGLIAARGCAGRRGRSSLWS